MIARCCSGCRLVRVGEWLWPTILLCPWLTRVFLLAFSWLWLFILLDVFVIAKMHLSKPDCYTNLFVFQKQKNQIWEDLVFLFLKS